MVIVFLERRQRLLLLHLVVAAVVPTTDVWMVVVDAVAAFLESLMYLRMDATHLDLQQHPCVDCCA